MDMDEDILELKLSNRFKSAFKNGQDAEFGQNNLEIAKKQYSYSLNYSTRSIDSVKAINALGRISIKLNQYKNAISYYKLVVFKIF